jgi:hypothetical protein
MKLPIGLLEIENERIEMNNTKVPENIRELSYKKTQNFYSLLNNTTPREITPGQIWSTRSYFELPNGEIFHTDEPKLVTILIGEGELFKKYEPITVAPISIHTSMASEYDFIIRKEENLHPFLPFDIMIEIWNETPTLKGHLQNFIWSLSEGTTKAINKLFSTRLLNLEISEDLLRYIGMRIIADDDPRLSFQEEEINAAAYLAKAATAILSMDIVEQVERANESLTWTKFEIVPFLGKLSTYFQNQFSETMMARAANSIDLEEERCLIVQTINKNKSFVFELLNSRSRPFLIYLKTYSVAPEYIGHNCIISVITKDQVYKSESIELYLDIKIDIGKDAHFQCEKVELVELLISTK